MADTNADSGQALLTSIAIAAATTLGIFVYDKFVKRGGGGDSDGPSVRELNVYPVKSCAEMQVLKASVTPLGFRHDRTFQVVSKADGGSKAWAYCTPRDKAYEKLFLIRPSVSGDGKSMTLTAPDCPGSMGTKCSVELAGSAKTSPLLATVMGDDEHELDDYGDDVAEWIGRAVGIVERRLVGIPSGKRYNRRVVVNADQGEDLPSSAKPIPVSLADEAPFLLTSRESLEDLNKRLKAAGKNCVDMRRFRPNVVIDGLKPWEEDTIKRLRIGAVEFHVWQRCGRCTMTTIDRDTLRRCGEPLNTLSTFRERANGQRNFGMHMIPVKGSEGKDVVLGDKVEILEYDEERRREWAVLFNDGNAAVPKKSKCPLPF